MGFLAQTPHGKPGESGAVGDDVLEVADGNRLGLGHAVDVHELGQDILHPVFLQKGLGFVEFHWHTPFRQLAGKRPG